MLPKNSPPHKTILKTFFNQNVINNNKNNSNQFHQGLKKQKSTSFYGSFTPSYLRTPKENLNYPSLDRDGKRSLTPRFQLKSPAVIKNELLKFKQQSSQQKNNLQSQSLTNRKYSQMNIKKVYPQQNKLQQQLHTKRQYIQNRIKRFQSLRSTINTSNLNSHDERKSVAKNKNEQNQQKKLSHANQTARAKFFTLQFDHVKQNQQDSLKPAQSNRLNYSPSDRALDKKSFMTENRFTTFNPNPNLGLFQKPLNSQPLPKKDPQTKSINKDNQTVAGETKKQNKIPSFLNAKNVKKNQNNNSFKPKQFPKFFLSNLNSQKPKQQNKKLQNKALSANKHAKSFSVFQTSDFHKKDDSQKIEFSSTAESFHPAHKVKQNQFGIFNSEITQSKNTIINVLRPKQKSMRISPTFENRIKIGSSSLRQSLTKHSQTLKQSCSIQRLNFDKKQPLHQILPITFIPSSSSPKTSLDSFKKTMHNSKVVNDSQLSSSRRLSEQNQKKQSNIAQKKSIIDDIKQTLIGCDLLSEQDYQNVIQNHKNDILKTQKYKTNDNPTVDFKIELGLQKNTSIKNFIQQSQQQSEYRFSIQQQKKLAQLAQMCQQKRSKWILQQTDTIKQSLKQLSQFNTEKSLYDNEWKKISVKDFATTRNNRINSNYFRQMDQVREQDINYQSKQQSKLSSIKVLSQNCIQQNQYQPTYDHSGKFKKNKQKSVRIASLENFVDIQSSQQSLGRLSLQDFEILWSIQEPIFLNKSAENIKSLISYGARHKPTNFIFRIKKFEKNTIKDEGQQFLSKFIKSIKLQFFNFNIPHIEKLYAIFDDRYSIYFVCEFTQIRLSQVLIQGKKQKQIQSSEIFTQYINFINNQQNKATIFKEIIDGLQEIHLQHVIHKNIHPNSIRLIYGICKISGFTQAEMIDQPISRLCNEYICPQALFDSSKLAMDIWCLGILAYELLIGQKPFKEESQDPTRKVKKILQCSFDIPLQKVSLCQQFLNSALKRNPKDRASIFELKNIWARKIKENNFTSKISSNVKIELEKLYQS